jgi:hypothetical protein
MKTFLLPVASVVVGGAIVIWCGKIILFNPVLNGTDYRPKMDVRNIEAALHSYYAKHQTWPEKLDMLTVPELDVGAALLQKGDLIDPWGRPYQYDPNQLNPRTGTPRVWSDGPDPGNPDKKIANWY